MKDDWKHWCPECEQGTNTENATNCPKCLKRYSELNNKIVDLETPVPHKTAGTYRIRFKEMEISFPNEASITNENLRQAILEDGSFMLEIESYEKIGPIKNFLDESVTS